jgi:hypothetical protein
MEPLLGDMPLVGALSLFFLKKPVSSSTLYTLPLSTIWISGHLHRQLLTGQLFDNRYFITVFLPLVLSLQAPVLPKHLADLSQIPVPIGDTGALNRHRSG